MHGSAVKMTGFQYRKTVRAFDLPERRRTFHCGNGILTRVGTCHGDTTWNVDGPVRILCLNGARGDCFEYMHRKRGRRG